MLLQQKCNNNGVTESSKQQINCTNRMCHLFGWGWLNWFILLDYVFFFDYFPHHHHHRSNNVATAQLCDSRFGHCLCKQGWHGPKCDSCSSGYWNAAAVVATKDNNHIKNIDCKRKNFILFIWKQIMIKYL